MAAATGPGVRRANARPGEPAGASRPIYRFSIIRGGAYSRVELDRALDTDWVAARHYAGFQRALVHTVAARFYRPVYVSYRRGNSIYWTSHPVRVKPGEILLTDGTNYARARCGNRISEKPRQPVAEADLEPPPDLLDNPEPPLPELASYAGTPPRLAPEIFPPARTLSASRLRSAALQAVQGNASLPSWGLYRTQALAGGLPLPTAQGGTTPGQPPPDNPPGGSTVEPNPIASFMVHPLPAPYHSTAGGLIVLVPPVSGVDAGQPVNPGGNTAPTVSHPLIPTPEVTSPPDDSPKPQPPGSPNGPEPPVIPPPGSPQTPPGPGPGTEAPEPASAVLGLAALAIPAIAWRRRRTD